MKQQINNIAQSLSRVIDNDNIPELDLNACENVITYDGTFKTIYNMVNQGLIKILKQGDRVCGLSITSGEDSVERDNIAAYNFGKAYSIQKAQDYSRMAFALNSAGVVPDDIIEKNNNVYIYLYHQGKVLDVYGHVLVELDDEECRNTSFNNIRELLDSKLNPQKQTHNNPDEQEDIYFNKEYANSKGLYSYSSESEIKDFIRNEFKRYLKRDCKVSIEELEKGYKIKGVEFGRKM